MHLIAKFVPILYDIAMRNSCLTKKWYVVLCAGLALAACSNPVDLDQFLKDLDEQSGLKITVTLAPIGAGEPVLGNGLAKGGIVTLVRPATATIQVTNAGLSNFSWECNGADLGSNNFQVTINTTTAPFNTAGDHIVSVFAMYGTAYHSSYFIIRVQ